MSRCCINLSNNNSLHSFHPAQYDKKLHRGLLRPGAQRLSRREPLQASCRSSTSRERTNTPRRRQELHGADTSLCKDPDGLLSRLRQRIQGQLPDHERREQNTLRRRAAENPIERLDHADIEDMFYFTYRRERPTGIRNDAGRCRNERLFKYMYGSTPAEVRKHLVKVPWNGSYVLFSKVNGAAAALAAVNRELQQHPELKKYLVSSGTFNWRYIRGTKRLSSHAFATAIDIGVAKYADYWKNAGKDEASTQLVYRNRMPLELAKIFEKHGFIWGGYWYHYDTMHFEYHPEIIAANP